MNIYFSGLGGVGIGPLVEIAQDMGHTVMGSDLVDSLQVGELRSRGVSLSIGQDGSFLQACHQAKPIDWFVYTLALPDDHPELVLAKKLGIRTSTRDEFLTYVLQEKDLKLLAVSGTHGKTTTTSMLIWTLQQLGVPVSYAVGTTLPFGPNGKYDPASEYFVYECDEYGRTFLNFHPYLSLVTAIDYDHQDTYPKESDYIQAFRQFIDQSDHAILWQQDADHIGYDGQGAWVLQETIGLALPGEHNRRNGSLVVKAAEYLGLSADKASLALASFPGANRRFEKLADNLYTDYGHHPTEIAATLQLAREAADHVVLVYQPHQNRRQYSIRDQYHDQFELADEVYWLPTYLSREDPEQPILAPEDLFANLTNKDHVQPAQMNNELWNTIQQARNDGKLVLCMGAGSIDSWVREKLAE